MGGMAAPQTVPVEVAGRRRGTRGRPGLGHHRLERPGEPHVIRDLGLPEALRLQPGEGREAHARRAPQGQGDRLQRRPGADGVRRDPAARLRAVGDGRPADDDVPARRGDECVATFTPQEAQVLRQCVAELAALLSDVRIPTIRPSSGSSPMSTPRIRRRRPSSGGSPRPTSRRPSSTRPRPCSPTCSSRVARSASTRSGPTCGCGRSPTYGWRWAPGWGRGRHRHRGRARRGSRRDPTSPRVGQLSVYAYLSFLQESLVGALDGLSGHRRPRGLLRDFSGYGRGRTGCQRYAGSRRLDGVTLTATPT